SWRAATSTRPGTRSTSERRPSAARLRLRIRTWWTISGERPASRTATRSRCGRKRRRCSETRSAGKWIRRHPRITRNGNARSAVDASDEEREVRERTVAIDERHRLPDHAQLARRAPQAVLVAPRPDDGPAIARLDRDEVRAHEQVVAVVA